MRFKLLVGLHWEGDRLYKPGDIIETDRDLSRFNHPTGERKFERLPDEPGVSGQTAARSKLGKLVHEGVPG